MEKTKENKEIKKGKHKANPTLGDIVFRVLIIVVIFFIVLISYVFYIQQVTENTRNINKVNTTIIKDKK